MKKRGVLSQENNMLSFDVVVVLVLVE